jgi:hypothetical protein
MDISSIIARIVSDCDLRNRFLKQFPSFLDGYELSRDGQILTKELDVRAANKYLSDGLSFVSSRIRL